jgi:hypothetical protein
LNPRCSVGNPSSKLRRRSGYPDRHEGAVFLGLAELVDRPEELPVSTFIWLDAAKESGDLRRQAALGPVLLENVFHAGGILSEGKVGPFGIGFSTREGCAVADLVERRAKVVDRVENDARPSFGLLPVLWNLTS